MKPSICPHTPSAASLRRSASTVTALVMAHGLAADAHAALSDEEARRLSDESATPLPELVVAGERQRGVASPKFTEPLRDTPQTLIVIPQDVYTQQGAASLSDVLRNTPGITFAAGEGGGASNTAGDAFYLRGFDASNNIFVDGVRDVGAYTRDVFNLEQVEVAKGPAGADVGRGVSSGYVNLATKTPRAENFTAGTLVYGFDDTSADPRQRATIDVNQTLPASPLKGTAVRINALWQDSGVPGRAIAENKVWSVAPSLSLGLGTPTRAMFSYQHTEQENLPDYGLPGAAFPGNFYTPPPPPIDRTTFFGFTSDRDAVTSDSYLARFEHVFSADAILSNQTKFSAIEREAIVTTPGNSPASYVPGTQLLTRSRQGNRRNSDILSNQTNLVAHFATGKVAHNLSAGLEFTRENAYSPAFANPTLTPILVNRADPHAEPSGTPQRSGARTDTRIDSAALYAFDTLRLTEHWQLTGGARLERYRVNYLAVATNGVRTELDVAHTILTWKGGLVFKPAEEGSIYVSYGLSEKPPGSDFTLSSATGNQNNPDTDPQRTKSIEAGVKWDFLDHRLSTSAAVFRTENDRTVFTDPVLGPIPAGRQTVQGLELNVSGSITDQWLVFAGFAYLDSEYNAGTAAQTGAGLPLVPRVSGNLWTTYRLPVGLTLGGGAQYSGKANRLQTSAAAPLAMPSYWLVNAVASYPIHPRLTLRFNVNNVLDEEYVQSYNNNGGRFSFGAPRTYLFTAEWRF